MTQNILFYDDSIHKFIKSNLTEANLQNLSVWQQQSNNPTSNDIPPNLGSLWLNTNTGELFVCNNIDENGSYWKGQLGTIVVPSTLSIVDIFGDGSCVALWRFDGNANDDGGVYNGTWHGTVNYAVGKFSQCSYLNGSSYISIPGIDISSKTFSISVWVKRDSSGSGYGIGIPNQNSTSYYNSLVIVSQTGDVYIGQGQKATGVVSSSTFTHLVAVYRQTGCDLYVNNTIVLNNVTVSTNYDPLTNIGYRYYNGAHYFKGWIDQLRIFNKALSSSEVSILYNES